jgi:cysteine desulfurase / selenocysteine lyase
VIDALTRLLHESNANVHRGVHHLSERATDLHRGSPCDRRRFLNAGETREIVFVRGTTEAINLVAQHLGSRRAVGPGDEILISTMEHHANIVPWQMLCERDRSAAAGDSDRRGRRARSSRSTNGC